MALIEICKETDPHFGFFSKHFSCKIQWNLDYTNIASDDYLTIDKIYIWKALTQIFTNVNFYFNLNTIVKLNHFVLMLLMSYCEVITGL